MWKSWQIDVCIIVILYILLVAHARWYTLNHDNLDDRIVTSTGEIFKSQDFVFSFARQSVIFSLLIVAHIAFVFNRIAFYRHKREIRSLLAKSGSPERGIRGEQHA